MTELKPCPFCDEKPEFGWFSLEANVHCPSCYCQISMHAGNIKNSQRAERDCKDAWNNRPIEDALRARIKELEDFCVTLSGMKNTEGLDAEQMLEDVSEKAWMHLMGKIDD